MNNLLTSLKTLFQILVNFSFTQRINTLSILPIIYGFFVLSEAGLCFLFILYGFEHSLIWGGVFLIISPMLFLILVMITRATLETVLDIGELKQDIHRIAEMRTAIQEITSISSHVQTIAMMSKSIEKISNLTTTIEQISQITRHIESIARMSSAVYKISELNTDIKHIALLAPMISDIAGMKDSITQISEMKDSIEKLATLTENIGIIAEMSDAIDKLSAVGDVIERLRRVPFMRNNDKDLK